MWGERKPKQTAAEAERRAAADAPARRKAPDTEAAGIKTVTPEVDCLWAGPADW